MKTEAVKAKVAKITIAGIELEAYQMPEGHYKLSLSQLATALELQPTQLRRLKGLQNAPVESLKVKRGKRFEGLQAVLVGTKEISEAAMAFALRGNKLAEALMIALVTEAFERRCDAAFGVKKTEVDYEVQTKEFYRELARKSFHPQLTSAMNGSFANNQWAKEINRFKRAAGLPVDCVDNYSKEELQVWTDAMSRYNCLTNMSNGKVKPMTHNQALEEIKRQRIDREVAQA